MKYVYIIVSNILILSVINITKLYANNSKNNYLYKNVDLTNNNTYNYYTYIKDNQFIIKQFKQNISNDIKWVAKLSINKDDYNKTGWSLLKIQTNDNETDVKQAYAAGLLEGYHTKELIWLQILNIYHGFCDDKPEICNQLYKFLSDNIKWMKNKISSSSHDPYWHQVKLVLTQFIGLYHGYISGSSTIDTHEFDIIETYLNNKEERFLQIFALQLSGDIDELLFKFNKKVDPFWASACSAFIKLTNNNEDLLVSHNTWLTYEWMLRFAKHYEFNYHYSDSDNVNIPGIITTFSSFPGFLISMDDFYITKPRLAIQETTIGNSNVDLWEFIKSNNVLYWIRVSVANRLASNAIDWAKWFSMYNSGTYNNQWMIVDFNKFIPNVSLNDGLLVILEQLPGKIVWKDKTNELRQKSYWSSYNLPYFEEINNISGVYNNSIVYGSFFSHDKSPRASIFRRDNNKVHDINSLIKLMRYNNYTKEPFSKCDCSPPYSAYLTIAARTDLNQPNGTYKYPAFGHRNHGAIDLKVTDFKMSKRLEFIAINGPTFEDVPMFVWNKTDFKVNHFGHPNKFMFLPIHIHWKNK